MNLGSRVGVVIPTRNRPQLVRRAVESVLAQTHHELEVVVVVDGPDDATQQTLAAVRDSRLQVITSPKRGASAARNTGVRMLNTDWIAFLDDDDTWLPGKLEAQLRAAAACSAPTPILSCRTERVTAKGTHVEPRRLPRAGEQVSEYLFHPSGFTLRRGYIQTSTLLAPRTLALAQPFDETLPRHQDWDWTLRVVQRSDVQLVLVPEVLVTVDQGSSCSRISMSNDWRYSLEWIRARRGIVTDRAYSGFVASVVAAKAARGKAGISEFWEIIKEVTSGSPTPSQVLSLLTWIFVPDRAIRLAGASTS